MRGSPLLRDQSGSPSPTLSSKVSFPNTTKNQRQILSPINPAKKLAKSNLPTMSQSVAIKSPIDSRKCLAN